MKRNMMAITVATVLVAGALTGCGGGSETVNTKAAGAESTAAGAAETNAQTAGDLPFAGQELSISIFSLNAELLQRDIYDPLMAATGCELIVEGRRNTKCVAKTKELPANYDVVIIGDAFIVDLIDVGLVETVDSTKLISLDVLYDIAKAPFDEEYGPAHTFNCLGIIYDQATTPVEVTKREELWDPSFKGSIAIPGTTATTGPLFHYSATKMIGLELDKDDDAIFAKLAELKPNVAKTHTSANDIITILNQGEVSAAVLLGYSYMATKETSEDCIWVSSAEGNYNGYNTINVVKSSENKELAEAFIDFHISKEVQLAEALDGADSPVRKDVELIEEQSTSLTHGADVVDNLLLPGWSATDISKANWTERWNELFSVK